MAQKFPTSVPLLGYLAFRFLKRVASIRTWRSSPPPKKKVIFFAYKTNVGNIYNICFTLKNYINRILHFRVTQIQISLHISLIIVLNPVQFCILFNMHESFIIIISFTNNIMHWYVPMHIINISCISFYIYLSSFICHILMRLQYVRVCHILSIISWLYMTEPN